MPKINLPRMQLFYDAAEQFVESALRNDDSLFTPGIPIWTPAIIDELRQRFVERLHLGEGDFLAKLKQQLETPLAGQEPTPQVYQLTAEMLYVHLMINIGTTGQSKRDVINTILNWSPQPVTIPAHLDQVLDTGVAYGGMGFNLHRPYHLVFLVNFMRHWKSLPPHERDEHLQNPWTFRQMIYLLPLPLKKNAQAQREALLHLVHPETFENIILKSQKKKLLQTYGALVQALDVNADQHIADIRQKLTPIYGHNFDFHTFSAVWEEGKPFVWKEKEPVIDHQHMLPHTLGDKLRPYVQLVTHMEGERWYTPGDIVNILGRITPPIAPGLRGRPDENRLMAELLQLRLLEPAEDERYRRWDHLGDCTLEYLMTYAALTLLVSSADGGYRLPILDAPFDGSPHPTQAWPVGEPLLRWYEEAKLVERTPDGQWQGRPDALEPRKGNESSLRAINTFLEHLQQVRESQQHANPIQNTSLQQLDPATLDQRIAEIQRTLLIDRMTILRIYRALIGGHHVILSGPPGTGKTHLARLLPTILWRDHHDTITLAMPTNPLEPPTDPPVEQRHQRQGYAPTVVTATEDWGVRHVIGGIAPRLLSGPQGRTLVYSVRHGCLTRAVLDNYAPAEDHDIRPLPDPPRRQEVREKDGTRYRGRWLVIDEFTRAPIDAAFGSLLTTLGGQRSPLIVPTDDGDIALPLPRDFRIIGTLNSFDRHFLNQMSEAMKRRFVFIDVLPPTRAYADAEQAMALYHALLRLSEQDMPDVYANETDGRVGWEGILSIQREQQTSDNEPLAVRYGVAAEDDELPPILETFWRIFTAIRVYRQMGTAQAEAVYNALFTGRSVGMAWDTALDAALADTLADQLQVLGRDEQRVLLAFLEHAADPSRFTKEIHNILHLMPGPRQLSHLSQLRAAAPALPPDERIDTQKLATLTPQQLEHVFSLGEPLLVASDGLFAQRLNALVGERGL